MWMTVAHPMTFLIHVLLSFVNIMSQLLSGAKWMMDSWLGRIPPRQFMVFLLCVVWFVVGLGLGRAGGVSAAVGCGWFAAGLGG